MVISLSRWENLYLLIKGKPLIFSINAGPGSNQLTEVWKFVCVT